MATEMIPVANLAAQFRAHQESIREAVERVLESGWYILGKEVRNFEEEFATFIGAAHAVGVGSGTDAIAIALRAMGVAPGDEVITVSHTAVATVAAIEQIGAVPVFADIDPLSRCIDPQSMLAMISQSTKAVVVVHIYGQPADMQAILAIAQEHNLMVLEDCAQAHGAEIDGQKVGNFGHTAAFSFYPTKNLGALGDGGAVLSSDAALAERCRWLREYGWQERYVSAIPGVNSRLDEMQAAILKEKLRFLEQDNSRRRVIAGRYGKALSGTRLIPPSGIPGTSPVFHLYVVECDQREAFEAHMAQHCIATARHYPQPVHRQPAYAGRFRGGDRLPNTDRLYGRIVTLPMYPELTDTQVDQVCTALSAFKNL